MLGVSGLSKEHGSRVLFRDVNFQLKPGRRTALVGGNGAGKTTILEIIVGIQEADTGVVSRPKGVVVGYLPQELLEAWKGTVLDEVIRGAGDLLDIETQLRDMEAHLDDPAVLEAYGELQSRFEQMGGYQVEANARRILGGLGFSTAAMDSPLAEMSGGWQMRAALARLLLQNPDVLVLDEPTNHLDVDSVAWLEAQLQAFPGSLLFVSHDRDFIDSVADRIVELSWQTATEYVGGFVEFIVQREDRLAQLGAAAAQQQREREKVERFVERFRYKATKARQVQSRIKALERLEAIEVPKDAELKLAFAYPEPRRSSRVVIEMDDATIGYEGDSPVVTDANLLVERGQKLALIGPNGAGKSTVLKAILGQLKPTSGTVKLGTNVDVAYFAQHQVDALDLTRTVEQEFRMAVGEQAKNRNLRTVLGSFGFRGDAVERKVAALSGGERTRLALAETMCNPVNLLILDEPTNHLDLPSCDVLEDALRMYPGTVLLVSHDRHLVRSVAEAVVEVRDGRVTQFTDVEEHVLNPLGSRSSDAAPAPPKPTPAAAKKEPARPKSAVPAEKPTAMSNNARRDLEKKVSKLEKKVAALETEVASLQQRLADPEVYADKDLMNELIQSHETAERRLNRTVGEWEIAVNRL